MVSTGGKNGDGAACNRDWWGRRHALLSDDRGKEWGKEGMGWAGAEGKRPSGREIGLRRRNTFGGLRNGVRPG
jgi:hypothetical protein